MDVGRKERRKKWWLKRLGQNKPGSGGSSTRSVRKHVATLNTGKSTRQGKQSRHLRKQTPFSSTLGFRRLNDNRTSVLSLEKAGPDLKKVTESAEDSSEDDGSDLEECAESCDNSAWPSAPVVAGDSSSLRANLPSLGIAAINASTNSKLSGRKHRYIAFVGNLPFHATSEEVISHFRKRGVVIRELRLLTDKTTGCSKGCCFAEFCDAKTLQNMLKFHHSRMEGRRINVEVTCGGGGKGVTRMRKIKERNEKLRERQALKKKKQSPQK